MDSSTLINNTSVTPEFLAGGGELGQRIREYDWSKTALGPVETWPQSLRTCIRIMLTSRQPIWIGWGKDLIKFYNDPYKAIVGGKHPWALGTPASVVWKDIWRDIEPMLKQVMEKDEGTYVESQLLIMERNGYPEETYYTFSYTPIPGDNGKTEGMFCANTDDTGKIISERQLRTLTHLGKRLADCQTNDEVIKKTIDTLSENPQDFPFAIFRTISNSKAILTYSTPLGESSKVVMPEIDLEGDNPVSAIVKKAFLTKTPQVFEGISGRVGTMPKGVWEVSPEKAIVLPIVQTGVKDPYGILVVGLNPYRLLDENYSSFFSLIADQVATSFADVHVLEEERKRAEALAEIDRAKTTFFSNISHEFRTPLTLLLGPIEDALHDPVTTPQNKTRMEVAYRNALRMQRLVNTLLEFSRIEAGRMQGRFTKVDICSLTQDLASTFRSAIEKAGMQLIFDCRAIHKEVYVDVDMWEKIVLNLISNAFKYSKEGKIEVRVIEQEQQVEFSVADTGVGIPADQLDKIFDRFHRVENIQGRSQEGTGIGLAMVKELVRLHQGSIRVESEVGRGSTFKVSIPTGKDHLPADKVSDTLHSGISGFADAFVQEAMMWLPEEEQQLFKEVIADDSINGLNTYSHKEKKHTILLADDNADMRDYVQRLLSKQYNVVTAVNGEEAFNKTIKHKPSLLLSDIMMPKLDGFGLLNKVRAHPDTLHIPVIFLSARAGEEAKVEGLEAGADDYLVKPFTARELLARVDANIKIAQSRIAAENNLRNVILQAPVAMAILKSRNFIIEIANERALDVWGKTHDEVINRPALEAFPEIVVQGFDKILEGVYITGKPFLANEMPVTLVRHGKPETLFLNFIYEPLRNSDGMVEGILAVGIDVSEQVLSRKKIEQSQQELNEMANAVPQLVWMANPDGKVLYYNNRVTEFAGAHQLEDGHWHWHGLLHPEDLATTEKAWNKALETGTVYQMEHRIQMKDGSYRWFLSRALPHKDEDGNIKKWFGSATDIHTAKEYASLLEVEVIKRTKELKELNQNLQQSNHELQQFAHVASHDLKEPLRKIKTFTSRMVEDTGNVFTERSKTYVSKINSATDRMFAMIEGVLNYSVINASEQKIEPVNLNQVMKNIEIDLELLISQKNATIQYHDLPVVEGSSVLLYQMLYNLVNNSLKFSRPDVNPAIHLSSSAIDINEKQGAQIRLDDNGIGFEQEYAEKIFESFARLNSKDRYEGTGLGLSLCKRIVERHGGTITAQGQPGKGATFLINLPLKQKRNSI